MVGYNPIHYLSIKNLSNYVIMSPSSIGFEGYLKSLLVFFLQ